MSEADLGWPIPPVTPFARTQMTCGHFGLLGAWEPEAIGQTQHCEVCEEARTVVGVVEL